MQKAFGADPTGSSRTTCNKTGACVTAQMIGDDQLGANDQQATLFGDAALDDDWAGVSHTCGQTAKARWVTHTSYATIYWTQGYCYRRPTLTWVGPLRHRVEMSGAGDTLGWEYDGVTFHKDGYFERKTAHSSVVVLLFKQCLPIPTGKWCHTTDHLWRRMVVYGLGSDHLFG